MSEETIQQEIDDIVEKARIDFYEHLKDENNWKFTWESNEEAGNTFIESQDRKYDVGLWTDGTVRVRMSHVLIVSEDAKPKVERFLSFFANQPKSEPTAIAKRIAEIGAVLEQRRREEKLARRLSDVKKAFER